MEERSGLVRRGPNRAVILSNTLDRRADSNTCHDFPDDPVEEHRDAVPVLVNPGDAVLFDRRIWHGGAQNRSTLTRKVIFLGYSYRWLKPRDDMTVGHYLERTDDPVRRQLLGASPNGGFGFTSPADEDVPLKAWIRDHVGEDVLVP